MLGLPQPLKSPEDLIKSILGEKPFCLQRFCIVLTGQNEIEPCFIAEYPKHAVKLIHTLREKTVEFAVLFLRDGASPQLPVTALLIIKLLIICH